MGSATAPKNFSFTISVLFRCILFTPIMQVLLYDIRSNRPVMVKDHNYELPIKSISFNNKEDIVLSMDKRIVKMWDRNTVS